MPPSPAPRAAVLPPPAPPAEAASDDPRPADAFRCEVEIFYERHKPEQLEHIDRIVAHGAADPGALLDQIYAKYGTAPDERARIHDEARARALQRRDAAPAPSPGPAAEFTESAESSDTSPPAGE